MTAQKLVCGAGSTTPGRLAAPQAPAGLGKALADLRQLAVSSARAAAPAAHSDSICRICERCSTSDALELCGREADLTVRGALRSPRAPDSSAAMRASPAGTRPRPPGCLTSELSVRSSCLGAARLARGPARSRRPARAQAEGARSRRAGPDTAPAARRGARRARPAPVLPSLGARKSARTATRSPPVRCALVHTRRLGGVELPRRPGAHRLARQLPARLHIWCSNRSCSSAASAWRFKGRKRVRASRSTSSERSKSSCVRSSFSCARRRRLRCLPRPAASSISNRRSRGLDVTISSTRPWEMTECVSLPRPVSDKTSITSVNRQRAPFRRYPPSPARSRRRTIEISLNGSSTVPSELSSTISTSAALRALDAMSAAEDHPASTGPHRERRLLTHRPQHRVGHIRLARPVPPHHHAHPRRSPGGCGRGKGLKALQRE